jgi:sucrose-6F-phosphate phosphohydrolase
MRTSHSTRLTGNYVIGSNRLLLCTDLDRTLIPNGHQPESPGARERFAELVQRPQVELAYVTGRHREIVESAMREYALPRPDYVVGDVGTSIYAVGTDDWRMLEGWQEDIGADWAGKTHADLAQLLSDIEALELQEHAKQNVFKLSYYTPVNVDSQTLIGQLQQRLSGAGVRAAVIWSIDDATRRGLVDVLPERATKVHAIEYLMGHLGYDVAHTVFSGDSGNDLPALVSGIHAVLVANAREDVREEALRLARERGNADTLYLARGNWRGLNGNYSAGILEGVAHFMGDGPPWFDR